MTDHPDIEAAARRVKQLYATPVRAWPVDAAAEEAELLVLAPQLAEAVLAMLPVIEAAERVQRARLPVDPLSRRYMARSQSDGDEGYDDARAALRAALAAFRGPAQPPKPLKVQPDHKGRQACRGCKGPNFCTCDDPTCWCNWSPDDMLTGEPT
jgi:hypothetical protein